RAHLQVVQRAELLPGRHGDGRRLRGVDAGVGGTADLRRDGGRLRRDVRLRPAGRAAAAAQDGRPAHHHDRDAHARAGHLPARPGAGPARHDAQAPRPGHRHRASGVGRRLRQPGLPAGRRHRPRADRVRPAVLPHPARHQAASGAIGISVGRAVAVSWGLAGICAVAAGTLWGAVQGVDWSLTSLLFPAVAVVILGGLDSIHGALVAGILVGVLGSVIPGYVDSLVGGSTRDVVTSVIILLTILIRPYGMFGREDIERI